MLKKNLFILLAVSFSLSVQAQLKFKETINLAETPVKSQDQTGTCWSYSTASYMESEAIRKHQEPIDLSEMFIVRYLYQTKAENYILRQGKTNFSQGALAHDFMRAMGKHGVVPQSVYEGRPKGEVRHNHSELVAVLKGYLDGVLAGKKPSKYWKDGFNAILDVYLGQAPENFNLNGQSFTPQSYANHLGLSVKDYIELTSFAHHPFDSYFVLEVPDNFSNGLYYNIRLKQLKAQTDYALEKGYTVSWDGDVSEKGFGRKEGVCLLPVDPEDKNLFKKHVQEIQVTQETRQESFENLTTTDDHLMHIVGKAIDQSGGSYYIIKNSWGVRGDFEGYLYMSEAYFLMKTIAIMLPQEALMKDVKPTVFLPVSME